MAQTSDTGQATPLRKYRHATLRLPNFDYAQHGLYFVTICTQNRDCLFGNVVDDELQLSNAGKMVERWWLELTVKFPFLDPATFYVVMPNHIHGIIMIAGNAYGESVHPGESLQRVMQWFKTMTTNEYIRHVNQENWPAFNGKLWQRSYYDHIIRDQKDWERICQYITENPARWAEDSEHPSFHP